MIKFLLDMPGIRGGAKSVEQEGVFSKMRERCNIKQQRGRGHNGHFFLSVTDAVKCSRFYMSFM